MRSPKNVWAFLLPSFLQSSLAFPIFTFNGTSSLIGNSSTANLVKDVQLPEIFIVCSSVKHARFDGIGFYSVIGKDSRDWMVMQFTPLSKAIKLAYQWDDNFRILGALKKPRLDYWYHVCAKIDLKLSTNYTTIEVAVNGDLIGYAMEKNITNKPNSFRMKMGADYYWNKQFQGSVSNIKVFREGNVTDLSSSPCTKRQNAILSWNPNDWKVNGSDWSLAEEFEDEFCDVSDNYTLAIPSMITFKESLAICKQLNNSLVPFPEDSERFHKYLSWHKTITGGACRYIWTPFSDEDSEGSFLNMNSLAKAKLQFWAKGQPNGGIDENFVGIRMSSAGLIDRPQTALSCSSCLISSSLLLQLDGRCKYSLIGNAIFKEPKDIMHPDFRQKIQDFECSVPNWL